MQDVPFETTPPQTDTKSPVLKAGIPRILVTLGILWLLTCALNAMGIGVFVKTHALPFSAFNIKAGSTLERSFRLVNYSTQPVAVYPQPTCGCEVLDKDKFTIPPLSSGEFAVKVRTDGLPAGTYNKAIQVRFNAGAREWREEVLVRFNVH